MCRRAALPILALLLACATARPAGGPAPAAAPGPSPAAAASPAAPAAKGSREVDELLACLSAEEKIAQLLLAYPPPGDGPIDQGGVLLLGRMLKDPEALRARVAALQRRARLPLLVAVDLEGGELNRLKALRTMQAFPSAREMGEEGRWEAEAWGRRAGLDLAGLGVNMSLGPVLDLADRGFMAETGRSLGTDAVQVARLARSFSRGLASAGVLPVGKHYPGYGPVPGSSDRTLLVVDRSPQEIARHQAAFVSAADVLAGVMMANVGFASYGSVPAILAPALVARAHLSGFLTVTDDLAVPSLLAACGGDAAELWRGAFLAGNDVLLTTSPLEWAGQPDPRRVLGDLLRGRPDLLPRLDESVRRLLQAKARAGLGLSNRCPPAP